MKVVCLSDTHGLHEQIQVPDGDLLIVAGDICNHGRIADVAPFDAWLGRLPHRHKVVIAGNHDRCFESQPQRARSQITRALYLEDEGVEIEGFSIYGSPWQPWFYDWAFNLRRGEALRAKWEQIPASLDILITHGPPQGILDKNSEKQAVGCADLMTRVLEVEPMLHVFGHIHEGYGIFKTDKTIFVNASNCDLGYRPINPPVVIELIKPGGPG